MVFIGDRVARADVLEADTGTDIARQNFLDVFALVGVHLQQTPNTFRLAPAGIEHGITRF